MAKRPAIPNVPTSEDKSRRGFDSAVKERLELLAGERGGKLAPLPANATLCETITFLNKLLELLQ